MTKPKILKPKFKLETSIATTFDALETLGFKLPKAKKQNYNHRLRRAKEELTIALAILLNK